MSTFDKIKSALQVGLIILLFTAGLIGFVLYEVSLYDQCYNHNRAWACAKLYGR